MHTKLDNIEEGIKYCGLTMKRQLAAKEYELKDWCINALSLADAYLTREHFAQAEYLYFAALNVLPESQEENIVELRAMAKAALGKYYAKRLEIGVALYIAGKELIMDKVNQKLIDFPELQMNWPEVTNMDGMNGAKTFFRLANTQFKKALEYYVLEGFVTEHV